MTQVTIQTHHGLQVLMFSHLLAGSVLHGFSLRTGGVSASPYDTLNMGFHVGDDRQAVRENRRRFAAALGFCPQRVVSGQQIHGTAIVNVTQEECGRGADTDADALPGTDGLLTGEPGVVLMAHAADCALLFFYEATQNYAGLAHAGWRGAVAGLAPAMVEKLAERGCRREAISVALSPAIGPCCYRVGEEVVECVPEKWRRFVLRKRSQGYFFDLSGLLRLLLLEAGIKEENLVMANYCTSCHSDKFFSYRRAGGRTGRMAGIIALPKVRAT